MRVPYPPHVYANCLIGILDATELTEDLSELRLPSFKVTLPSSENIGAIWPDSQQLVALPQGLQRTVSSPASALYMGFRLLGTLVECCFSSPQGVANCSVFEPLRPWALSSCLLLWSSFTNWTADVKRNPLDDDIEASYMQSLSILALPNTDWDQYWSSNAMALFTSGLIDAIRTCLSRPFSQANQARLAYVLIRLQSIVQDIEGGGIEKSRCVVMFLVRIQENKFTEDCIQ